MTLDAQMLEAAYETLRRQIPKGRWVPPRTAVAAALSAALRTLQQVGGTFEDDSRDDDG